MALTYYGFNSNPVAPLFGKTRSANSFLIDGMGPEEWVDSQKRNGIEKSFNDFYDVLKNTINESANSVFGPAQDGLEQHFGPNALKAINLEHFFDRLMSFTKGTNLSDIQQVLGDEGFNKWKSFAKVIEQGTNATGIHVFGLDLETFGDITNPKASSNNFGVTEIAINERTYVGKWAAGKMSKDGRTGSFAFGINSNQQMYLKSLAEKFKSSGWDNLTRTEQVALSRASRYRGIYDSVFTKVDNTIFSDYSQSSKQYLMVKKLANEQLSFEAFISGINNLGKAYNDNVYSIKEFIKQFMGWITDPKNKENIIYGANSNFDYNGLRRIINSINDNDIGADIKQEYIAILDRMEKETVDVVYAPRVFAAANGQTITEYMKSLNGIAGNATVQGQSEASLFKFIQEHRGDFDIGNEGKLADLHAQTFLKLFADNTKREDLLKTITTIGTGGKDTSLDDVVLFIRNGELDKTKGYEYAYRPIGNDGQGQSIANYSLKGEYYRFDLEHSGIYRQQLDKDKYKDRYVLTLVSAGDIATEGRDKATRIVFTTDTHKELMERAAQIAKTSSLFKLEEVTEDEIFAQQIAKYRDDGRRQFQKLLSSTDVRVVRGKHGELISYGGIRTLSDMYNVMDVLANDKDVKFDLPSELPLDITPETIAKRTRDIIDIFGNDSANRFGETKIPFISGEYQLKAFMAFSPTLANERVLHKRLMQIVGEKFNVALDKDRKPNFSTLTPEDNARATALYKQLYDAAVSIMDNGDARLKQVITKDTYIDKFRLDIKPLSDNELQFSVNLHSIQETTNDFDRYLKTLARQNRIGDFEAVVENLVGKRKVINFETYKSTMETLNNISQNTELERDRGLHDVAVQIATGIHKNKEYYERQLEEAIATNPDFNPNKPNYLEKVKGFMPQYSLSEYSITGRTASNLYKSYTKVTEPNTSIPFSERYTQVESQVEEAIGKIISKFDSVKYRNYGELSELDDTQIEAITKKILGNLKIDVNDESTGLIKQIFKGQETNSSGQRVYKSYSLKNYADNGISTFLVSSGKDESSMFFLFTNQQNRAKLQQMIESGKYNDAFSSYRALRNSDIASVAAIEELSFIKKYIVDESGTALMSVKQGDAFERFLVQTLRTYKGKDGKLQAILDRPDTMLLSVHRRAGSTPIEHIQEGDFETADRIFRNLSNETLKEMPNPADVSGVDRVMSLTSNDIMHAYEHRLIGGPDGGLDTIFESFVFTDKGGASASGRNHAQELVYQFGQVLGMNPDNNDFNKYARDVMNTSQWDEFFRRRLVNGKIIDEPWLLRDPVAGFQTQIKLADVLSHDVYKDNIAYNYQFDRSILQMMKDMVVANETIDRSNL